MVTTKAQFRTDSSGEVHELILPINPVPASRPRMGQYGTYYGKKYATWKATAEEMCGLLAYGRQPTDALFHVAVHSVVLKPRAGKLPAPIGDVDNYVKAPLDAITKAQLLWHDDKQVVTLLATKRYALGGEAPHTYVKAAETLGGLWLDFADKFRLEEDVYGLPESMRVPLEWYKETFDAGKVR